MSTLVNKFTHEIAHEHEPERYEFRGPHSSLRT